MKKHFTKFIALSTFSTFIAFAPGQVMAKSSVNFDTVEVAFVLDTTGSMAGLIEGAKRKIWSIANTIVDINPNADIRMALVAYRDVGDEYVTRTYDMSDDIQGLYGNLLSLRAAGGGDTPESVNKALDLAVDKIEWEDGNNVRRIVFLVGDAPPHMDYDNGPKYPDVLHQAVRQNIVVHAVQAGRSSKTRKVWQDIAKRGGGDYIAIPQDGGQIAEIETPYDDQIIQLQQRLNKTVVPYGTRKVQAELEDKVEQAASGPVSKQVDNSAFYSKRTRKEVVTGGGDIVSAVRNEDVALESVATEELPAVMQDMSAEEQKSYIGGIIKEREEIELEMRALVDKRDEFITEKEKALPAPAEDSFDRAARLAIKRSF